MTIRSNLDLYPAQQYILSIKISFFKFRIFKSRSSGVIEMEYWLYIIFISCHKTKLDIGFGIVHTFERNNMSRDSNLKEKLEGECNLFSYIVLVIVY